MVELLPVVVAAPPPTAVLRRGLTKSRIFRDGLRPMPSYHLSGA